MWRKYEHFCKVYDNLCSKYANHKIAKLPSLDRIKKTWKNFGAGSMAATQPEHTGHSSGGAGGTGSGNNSPHATTDEEDADDAIFLGHAFLQKLQVCVLNIYLNVMCVCVVAE